MSALTRFIAFAIAFGLAALMYAWSKTFEGEINQMLGAAAAFILAGLVLAGFVIIYIVPWLASRATDVAYDSSASVEDDPRWKAIALRNNHQFEEAIAVFRKVDQSEPQDRYALTEVYQIHLNKLEDTDTAWNVLEEGAAREWPNQEDRGYFFIELAKLAKETYADEVAEINVLERTIEALPETRFSANATHRLRELQGTPAEASPDRPEVARPVVPHPGSSQADA